jgi:hypothetical protein
MAIYRFEAKIIGRSSARSAVASAAYRTGRCATSAAAYRAAAKLVDERTGESFDYTRKGGVLGAEIITPEGAPEWMQDRARLWNEVEKVEKRKDSQLARDFVISLPHELSAEQRETLTREFVREQFAAHGYVADIAWHAPDRKGDERNYHAHVMVPMRKVEGNGFASKKERAPEGQHPSQVWKQELGRLREEWANTANRHLEAAGLDLRLDHRSLAERGIDREPEPKQGPLATKIEREGRDSLAGKDRRTVKARNAEREGLHTEVTAIDKEIAALEAQALAAARALSLDSAALANADALSKLEEAERADEKKRKDSFIGAKFAESARDGAQDVRNEGAAARDAKKQEAWRERVEENMPKEPEPAKENALRVIDKATGFVGTLGDFMVDFVAATPPQGPQDARADMRGFATDPAARKQQILERQAAKEAAERERKALERMGEDMKAGKALTGSDIKALTPATQMTIKTFGDDKVRELVESARVKAQEYWKDGGRERER